MVNQNDDRTQQQHCAGKSRAGLQQERAHGVSPGQIPGGEDAAAAARALLADGDTNAQRQIGGLWHRAQAGQRGLHFALRIPLPGTLPAILEMSIHLLHFASRQPAVQILRKTSLHLIAAVHRASSPRDNSIPVSAGSGEPGRVRSQQRLQTGAPAHQPRFHRSQIDALHRRYFLVNKSFDVAQDERGAEWLRHLTQRPFNAVAVLLVHGHFIGRFGRIDQHVFQPHRPAVFPIRHLLLDGDLLLLMAHPPAALVGCLAQRNAINPGPQRRLAVKTADAAEDLDENFLGEVGSVGAVAHGARQQRINRLMVVRDQPGKRLFRAGSKFLQREPPRQNGARVRWQDCPW